MPAWSKVLGNGLALAPPTRHQDRLTPVAEASVIGRLEKVFQLLLFPTFKGVWSAAANFVLLPLLDTRPGQYPQRHR